MTPHRGVEHDGHGQSDPKVTLHFDINLIHTTAGFSVRGCQVRRDGPHAITERTVRCARLSKEDITAVAGWRNVHIRERVSRSQRGLLGLEMLCLDRGCGCRYRYRYRSHGNGEHVSAALVGRALRGVIEHGGRHSLGNESHRIEGVSAKNVPRRVKLPGEAWCSGGRIDQNVDQAGDGGNHFRRRDSCCGCSRAA